MKINVRWFTFRLHIFKPKLSWALLHFFQHAIFWFCPFCFFPCDKTNITWHLMYTYCMYNEADWAYKQCRGVAEEDHIAAHPTLWVCWHAACVCRGCMASRVFVCTRLQRVNAAFSSSAPLQTVYGGIPVRLSVARSMPSLGRWPNSFCTQWLTLHVTMRVRGKKVPLGKTSCLCYFDM